MEARFATLGATERGAFARLSPERQRLMRERHGSNQDFAYKDETGLYVADGVTTSGSVGAHASHLIPVEFAKFMAARESAARSARQVVALAHLAAKHADAQLEQSAAPGKRGSTTLAALLRTKDSGKYVRFWAGDSGIVQIRNGQEVSRTFEQNVEQPQIVAGKLRPQTLLSNSFRGDGRLVEHHIGQVYGEHWKGQESMFLDQADILEDVEAGDIFVLHTDGLNGSYGEGKAALPTELIAADLARFDNAQEGVAQQMADSLITLPERLAEASREQVVAGMANPETQFGFNVDDIAVMVGRVVLM